MEQADTRVATSAPGAQPIRGRTAIRRVIAAYDQPIIRAYSWGRFQIFRQRFLDEIGQYLPEEGRVLDIGCGFGLFGLYFAQVHPRVQLSGFDLSESRVAIANDAARKLGIANARFEVGDATELRARQRFDVVYMLDVVHHVAPATVRRLIEEVHASLPSGGRLLVKELDTEPAWQRVFAHVLDLAMSPSQPPHYWAAAELSGLLREVGFDVKRHAMVDILPYPHVLYVATKR